VQLDKEGTRGEPFDMTDEAWTADYADPFDFINVLLDGRTIQASNNHNLAYFNDPSYNKKMTQASLLTGAKRYQAYGALDIDVTKNAVPLVPRSNGNNRIFVSKHVGCFTYNSIYSVDLAALCVK
jgi:ABC-type oligopeptide transport system substrate-binding subunit